MEDLNFLLLFALLTLSLQRVHASGQIKFNLLNFSTDEKLETNECCNAGETKLDCVCGTYVHVCFSVCFETDILYKDCTTACSGVLAVSRLNNSYNASIAFKRWPEKNVSITVEVRQNKTEAVILRSEHFLNMVPFDSEPLQFHEKKLAKRISYEVVVTCDANYYGADCSSYCTINLPNTHHHCSPYGTVVCNDGWTGLLCRDPICPGGCGHGSCISPGNCSCNIGWQGQRCDQCFVKEGCQHGYCNKPFECICEKNWGGLLCNRDLDYCSHHFPCQNGGTCSSGGKEDYYYCNCTAGFTGRNCEHTLNVCANPLTCGDFGRCILNSRSADGYFCVCDADHFGRNCEKKIITFDGTFPDTGIIHFPLPNSCQLSQDKFVPSGFKWRAGDCQTCGCNQGTLSCNQTSCKETGCFCETGDKICGKYEVCVKSLNEECLKPPCSPPSCSRCVLQSQKNRDEDLAFCKGLQDRRRIKDSEVCSALFLQLDLDILYQGTTTEDVCYHLVHEIELFRSLDTRASLYCSRFHDFVVQVDFASADFKNNVTIVKEFLKRRLQAPMTTSAILRSIKKIAERDSSILTWDRNLPKPTSGVFVDSQRLISTNQILVVILLLLVSVFLVLLSVCVFKYTDWVAAKRALRENHPKAAQPCIYYTKPNDEQPKMGHYSTILVDHTESPFLERSAFATRSSSAYSSFCGEIPKSKEVEDNEKNAHLLKKLAECGDCEYVATDGNSEGGELRKSSSCQIKFNPAKTRVFLRETLSSMDKSGVIV